MTRELLPTRRWIETRSIRYEGQDYTVSIGYYADGRPGEVFADGAKTGSDRQATLADACVLISIALQHGISPAALGHSLARVPRWEGGQEEEGPASVIGAIVEVLGC